ncbi:MAG: hypothetical protein NZ583_00045 [Desulfobacterota bacterium]|nr:hypothetical protein [Thermodesulfobacteriota bacterium]MDW8001106.1 hypothetical protein [Deltaproteobacteria bacterium]
MLKRILLISSLFFLTSSYSFAFWPIYYEFGEEKRFLGPLISWKAKKEEKKELVVRPLLLIYEENEKKVLHFPYPLGRFENEKSYFVPFFMAQRREEKKDYSFLLVYWGESEGENYGGFFPFYGEVKKRFGKDRIRFFLWPLYGATEIDGAKKENYLWPFFSLYSGEEKGYKIFPIYGKHERPDIRESQFFLWPFFYKERKNLDTDDPFRSIYLLPFYLSGKTESGSFDSYCIMFPLYCRLKSPGKVKKYYLWPFVEKVEGEEEGVSIFPLIRKIKTEDHETLGILWPFFYTRKEFFDERKKGTETAFLLLSRYEKEDSQFVLSLWPLLGYKVSETETEVNFPFIFPLKFEKFQKILNPLFSLLEYRKEGDWEGLNILYGLYTQERWKKKWKKRVGFIFEVKQEDEEISFRFLSGLLEVGNSKLTVFFVPFKRGQKDNRSGF